MLNYDRIDISEGIDFNKASELKEGYNCYYRQFLNKGFKFQPYVCVCHRYRGLLMMSITLAILPF